MRFVNRIIAFIIPPKKWKFLVIIMAGIFTGIGFLTIHISRAPSYLSDEPRTCINCHVMYPQYSTWSHSSHREVAVCNDCHVPQDNFFRTYYFKAMDGLRHSSVFTMRGEPQVIQIKNAGIDVVQENCIRCHRDLVEMISLIEVTGENSRMGTGKKCWECHRDVPHGTVKGLASTSHPLVPQLPSVLPEWLHKYVNK